MKVNMKVEERIIKRFEDLLSTANQLIQERNITGGYERNTEKDVEDMIRDVRRFMEDYFS